MQFTRLIASKAMTDAVGPPQISKCSIMKLKLRALPHPSNASVARQHDDQDLNNRIVIGSATKMRKMRPPFR
jgi:hypothetical protein